MKKYLIALALSMTVNVLAQTITPAPYVEVNTNGVIVSPTNFVAANGLGALTGGTITLNGTGTPITISEDGTTFSCDLGTISGMSGYTLALDTTTAVAGGSLTFSAGENGGTLTFAPATSTALTGGTITINGTGTPITMSEDGTTFSCDLGTISGMSGYTLALDTTTAVAGGSLTFSAGENSGTLTFAPAISTASTYCTNYVWTGDGTTNFCAVSNGLVSYLGNVCPWECQAPPPVTNFLAVYTWSTTGGNIDQGLAGFYESTYTVGQFSMTDATEAVLTNEFYTLSNSGTPWTVTILQGTNSLVETNATFRDFGGGSPQIDFNSFTVDTLTNFAGQIIGNLASVTFQKNP